MSIFRKLPNILGSKKHWFYTLNRVKEKASFCSSSSKVVDLRSDTFTKPSKRMRQAMADSLVGDDVYGEDPTVNELSKKMAVQFGKEAALFVPSGTMGNLICVLAHCFARGSEILLGDMSHIMLYEQGGVSQLGGIHPRTLVNLPDGTFDLDEMELKIRHKNDVHVPRTQLVCVENTHNACGGTVLPLKFMEELHSRAKKHDLLVHLDGARLMNAAVHLNKPISELVKHVDSVNMCFSKGLGAPVGSIICGSREVMERAERLRKVLGGGMRQAGVLAAAALVGMEDGESTLRKDHEHAQILANGINEKSNGILHVNTDLLHSNIIIANVLNKDLRSSQIVSRLAESDSQAVSDEKVSVKSMVWTPRKIRFVTNCNLVTDDIYLAIEKIRTVCKSFK